MPRARSRRSSSAVVASRVKLAEHLLRLRRVALDDLFGEPELHRQRDELLLRAVVDVAFELPALVVLGGDEPLPGRAELLDQPHAPKDQPRLRRQIVDQPLLRAVHRVRGGHRDGERAQQLVVVADLHGVVVVEPGMRFPSSATDGRSAVSVGQCAAGRSSVPTRSQTVARSAPIPLASTCAMRGSTSSAAYASPTRPENVVRTSYGDARPPKTSRSAIRAATERSGQNASPISTPATRSNLAPAVDANTRVAIATNPNPTTRSNTARIE